MSTNSEVKVPIIRPKWINITEQPVLQVLPNTPKDLLLAGLADGTIRAIRSSSGETIKTFTAHGLGMAAACLSEDTQMLVTCGEDNKLKIWNLDRFECVFEWKGRSWIHQILWKGHDFYFASGKTLYHGSMESGKIDEIETWEYTPSSLAFRDESELGVAGYSRISLYDLDSLKEKKRFEWKGALEGLLFSPRGRYGICSSSDLSIHIWDLKKDSDLSMRGFQSKIRDMSFRADGLYMANCSGPEVIVWDYMDPGPANKRPQVLGPFEKDVNFIRYQNKGKMLASFGADGVILFWRPDLFEDRPLAIAGIRDQSVSSAVWTEDDQYVVSGLQTGYVALYPVPEVKED